MVALKKRPGGELATRPLHFIWIADCSYSMEGNKIQGLNHAIREAIPAMQNVAADNVNAEVLVRAVKFSNGAKWHVAEATPVEDFKWQDLHVDGMTDMGAAFRLVADQLKMPPMTERGLPPVLVLISDGQPTDDFESGLKELMALPWGKKAVRIGIAIGEDADMEVLQQFIGNKELQPLHAHNAEQLVNYIRWVSTAVLQAASAPPSQVTDSISDNNVPIPPVPTVDPNSAADVW
ncbi:MAG: VWA domain-containing protein [Methylococcaceae bacterium]